MADQKKPTLKLVPASSVSIPDPSDPPSDSPPGVPPGESPDVVFIVDQDGTILYVNRSLPGRAQDDVLGTSLFDYIYPNHHSTARAGIERVFATGAAEGFEILGMAHQKSDSWYDCRAVPTKRGDKVVSTTIIARDVTMRKRVEGELRRELEELRRAFTERSSALEEARRELTDQTTKVEELQATAEASTARLEELNKDLLATAENREQLEGEIRRLSIELEETQRELADRVESLERAERALSGRTHQLVRREFALARFREMLDTAGEAILVIESVTGQIVDANDTACRWLSVDLDKLIQSRVDDYNLQFPTKVPEDVGDHVADTRDHRRPQLYGGEHRRLNGSSFPVEVAITRRRFGDKDYVLVIARDAKSRQLVEEKLRETEDQYRALFDLSRDAIYLSNRDGTIARVNDSAVELFGYTRLEFDGFPAKRLYRRSEAIRTFQKAVADDGFVREMAVDLVNKDGTVFKGLLTATLRHGGDGNVLGYQCVLRSVTEPRPAGPPSRKTLAELEARGHGTVLLIEPDRVSRSEVKQVLELAGVRVLVGESLAEALVIFKSRGHEIGAVLLAGDPREITNDEAFTEIRRHRPATRIVLLSERESEQRIVEYLAAAGLAGIVKKPFHPLALIQQIRSALDAGADPPAGSAPAGKPGPDPIAPSPERPPGRVVIPDPGEDSASAG